MTERGVEQGIDWFADKIVTATGPGIDVTNANTGTYLSGIGLHDSGVISVSWSPDGTKIASSSMDATVRIWDANINEPINQTQPILILSAHTLPVVWVDWNPSGTKLASASLDGTVRVWDATSGQLLQTIQVGAPVLNVQWSPDGTHLAYSGDVAGLGGTVKVVLDPSICTPPFSTPTITIAVGDVAGLKAAITTANGNGANGLPNIPNGSQITLVGLGAGARGGQPRCAAGLSGQQTGKADYARTPAAGETPVR